MRPHKTQSTTNHQRHSTTHALAHQPARPYTASIRHIHVQIQLHSSQYADNLRSSSFLSRSSSSLAFSTAAARIAASRASCAFSCLILFSETRVETHYHLEEELKTHYHLAQELKTQYHLEEDTLPTRRRVEDTLPPRRRHITT